MADCVFEHTTKEEVKLKKGLCFFKAVPSCVIILTVVGSRRDILASTASWRKLGDENRDTFFINLYIVRENAKYR
jgi:hypothetical protein